MRRPLRLAGLPTLSLLVLGGAAVWQRGDGAGGSGSRAAIRDGLRKGQRFDFLAVFPHGRTGSWAASSEDHELVLAVLDEVMDHYAVDRRRVYLTGLSSGGTGTWQLAAAHPERWAAIVPVCGSADPATAVAIEDLPCGCFHGTADGVAPVANLRRMLARLHAEGGKPRCTEYPGLGHGIWDKVYRDAELYDWLLRQHREQAVGKGRPPEGGTPTRNPAVDRPRRRSV
jgi:pimeloyl-ACP methyl ester carboxylesterase